MSCRACRPLWNLGMRLYHSEVVRNRQKLHFPLRSFWSEKQTCRLSNHSGRHTLSRCGPFFLGTLGEVEHIVHLIRWNSYSCLCHCGATWQRSRRGVTHDFCCRWNWVLFRFIVLVDSRPSPTSPHTVPNSSPVLLRNVSWRLGVCSVFVRSVSPRRLVLEVRSFPSPACAVLAFCPSSVSAFSFLLPFRVDAASARCVCV